MTTKTIEKVENKTPRKRRTKIHTFAPLFPGFYGTLFESDYYDELNEISGLLEDFIDPLYSHHLSEVASIIYGNWKAYTIDWKKYNHEYCSRICEHLSTLLEDIPGFNSIELEKVVSPKEYNFYNDSIDCSVCLNSLAEFRKWIFDFCKENEEEFSKWLVRRYTSRDGFISGHSNNPEDWFKIIKNKSLNGHYCGALLEFYFQIIDVNADDLYQSVERPCLSEYISLHIDKRSFKKIYSFLDSIFLGDKQFREYEYCGVSKDSVSRQSREWQKRRSELLKDACDSIVLK